jgi:hypothetical protein
MGWPQGVLDNQSRAMINILGLAVTSAWLSTYTIIFFYAPVALAGIGMLSLWLFCAPNQMRVWCPSGKSPGLGR